MSVDDIFVKEGLVEAIVKVINAHISNSRICNVGCRSLWTVATSGKH